MRKKKKAGKEKPVEVEDEKPETEVDQKEEKMKPTELERLKSQLEEREKEVADFKDRYLRLQAETENFKRRMREEKARDAQFANERLLKSILPMYENLGRALEAPNGPADSLKQGVDMIFKEFTSTLEKEKVKPIPTVGESFDPSVHEALSQVESGDHDDQTVLQEVSRGFYINDRVLRPARVVITKKTSPQENKEEKGPDSQEPGAVGKSGEEK